MPYGVSAGMDVPDPDPGEEYPHTNTQLFNVLDDANRFKDATEMVAPLQRTAGRPCSRRWTGSSPTTSASSPSSSAGSPPTRSTARS